jgi:hypothetical protein
MQRISYIPILLAVGLSVWNPTFVLAAAVEQGFTSLFDGKTLNGWKMVG